jgi:hypothetical protein
VYQQTSVVVAGTRMRAVKTVRALAAPLTAPLVATSAVGTRPAEFALVLDALMHAAVALPARTPVPIMLAYLRSPTLPARTPDPIMLASLRSPTLPARTPDPIMLAYPRSPTLPAPTLLAIVLAIVLMTMRELNLVVC